MRSLSRGWSSFVPCLLPLLVAILSSRIVAQCQVHWLPGAMRGTDESIRAVAHWDPDNAGPAAPVVVLGGAFTVAGTVAANYLATWDPATGQFGAFAPGNPEPVMALTVSSNGDLVVAGGTGVARWNGTSWSALGPGMNHLVWALAAMPNGDVIAGGGFSTAGGVPANGVARWNGTSWSPLGTGIGGGPGFLGDTVRALAVLPNGDLVAGGSFSAAGGVPASHIARWDGAAWSPLGAGLNQQVYSVAAMPNGDVVAGGMFSSAGATPASRIARWNGAAWSPVGSGMTGAGANVTSLTVLQNGDLVAGGWFTGAGSVAAPNIARWNGLWWSGLGGGTSDGVWGAVGLPNGDVVAAGAFVTAGGTVVDYAARCSGLWWSPLGAAVATATNVPIRAGAALPNGDLVAGGSFTIAGDVQVNRVARWDGTTWSAMGTGVNDDVLAVTALPNGDAVVGGEFTTAGGAPASHIARWNGSSWSALGPGQGGDVKALATMPNGDVVAAGPFPIFGSPAGDRLERWNGTSWSWLGGFGAVFSGAASVRSLAVLSNGDLVVGGTFTGVAGVAASNIVRWNGTSWSPIGGGVTGQVNVLAALPDGGLVAGGTITAAGGVAVNNLARWDGTSWSPVGTGTDAEVTGLTALPNGDLVAVGRFANAGGVPANRIARWNGTSWSPIGTGLSALMPWLANGHGVVQLPGALAVFGDFTIANGAAAVNFARIVTPCPATTQPGGAGCAGDTLVATLPWTGAVWRADASGLPNAALVAAVTGFATAALPLSAVFATALPGCTLHTQPDFVEVQLANGGAASFQLALPNAPSLAGIVFHHQMVALDLAPAQAVTATNALALTVGSF